MHQMAASCMYAVALFLFLNIMHCKLDLQSHPVPIILVNDGNVLIYLFTFFFSFFLFFFFAESD